VLNKKKFYIHKQPRGNQKTLEILSKAKKYTWMERSSVFPTFQKIANDQIGGVLKGNIKV